MGSERKEQVENLRQSVAFLNIRLNETCEPLPLYENEL